MAKRVESFNLNLSGLEDADMTTLITALDSTKVNANVAAYNGPIADWVGTQSVSLTMSATAAQGNDAAHQASFDHAVNLAQALGVATDPLGFA